MPSTHRTFEVFLNNIALTTAQRESAERSARSVIAAVSAAYWPPGSSSADSTGSIIGSFGRKVSIRPPRDVDVLVPLPWSVKSRFDALSGNGQSRLLADVRAKLLGRFPRTEVFADGPTVTVPFGLFWVEVIPAFEFNNTSYFIPDTNNGGSWKRAEPWGELVHLDAIDETAKGAARHLIQMAKAWQQEHDVPLSSFRIELLALEFIRAWEYRGHGHTYYDWMIRDFLAHILRRADGVIAHPSTGEPLFLWDDWVPRAERAHRQAVAACQYWANDLFYIACGEWQAIFGDDFPDPQ
jgi:hypothetical protein